MILLSLMFLFAVKGETDICMLPQEPGNCKGSFPRYFYNSVTKQCDKFIYGGCGGNENNFETLKECTAKCDICSLPKITGPCRGSFPRYFYDSKAGECSKFTYGGCGGNANNFESLAECENRCEPGPDCSLVRCAFPKCEAGQSTVIPDGECCPVCCEDVECIKAPCDCIPISNQSGSAFVIQLDSPWVAAMICVLGVALLCNIIFMCYMKCHKTRKGKGYYVVKHADSEDSENSEINPINVN